MTAPDIDLKELSGVDYSPIVIDHGSGMASIFTIMNTAFRRLTQTLVCEYTGTCKAGFAGEDLPRVIIPTAVAHLSYEEEQEWDQYMQSLSNGRSQVSVYRQTPSNKKPSGGGMITKGSAGASNESDLVQESVTIVGDDAFGIDRSNSSVSFSANSYTFNSVPSKNMNKKRDHKPYGTLISPMKRGIIGLEDPNDWDDMEKIWEAIFSHPRINCPPESQPVLFSECCENPKANRERISEIMFEKYKVPALYFAPKPVLSLYASGKSTGLVVQMGHSVTQAVPIFEGFPLHHAIVRMNFGGLDLTEFLKKQLTHRLKLDGHEALIDWNSIGGHKIATDIKEKMCQLSLNYERERSSAIDREYVLPDRSVIRIGSELLTTPEAVFNPVLMDRRNVLGVHEAVISVYDKCDGHMRSLLSQNVLLAGGSSNFPNMKARLSHELKYAYKTKYGASKMSAPTTEDNFSMIVREPRERVLSSWTGGSILASLPMFQQLWVSKGDYDDMKSQSLFSKCF